MLLEECLDCGYWTCLPRRNVKYSTKQCQKYTPCVEGPWSPWYAMSGPRSPPRLSIVVRSVPSVASSFTVQCLKRTSPYPSPENEVETREWRALTGKRQCVDTPVSELVVYLSHIPSALSLGDGGRMGEIRAKLPSFCHETRADRPCPTTRVLVKEQDASASRWCYDTVNAAGATPTRTYSTRISMNQ